MGPLKQKSRARHPVTRSYSNFDSPPSSFHDSSFPPSIVNTSEERSLSPTQIDLDVPGWYGGYYPSGHASLNSSLYSRQSDPSSKSTIPHAGTYHRNPHASINAISASQLAAMPKTDIPNSFSNPSINQGTIPREWVMPAPAYPSARPAVVKRGVVVPVNRPGYSVIANVNQNQPAILVGPNGRYYQQIPRYGASSSPPQKDGSHNLAYSADGTLPIRQPVMSTIQENNQTTHFLIPDPNEPPGSVPALINNYPALNPIYTMMSSPSNVPASNTHNYVGHVQASNNKPLTSLHIPMTSIPNQSTSAHQTVIQSPGVTMTSQPSRMTSQSQNVVTSQPRNPPDIISVIANPKGAMSTPIPTLSAPIPTSPYHTATSPATNAAVHQFKPSADGAFKPIPPKTKPKPQAGPKPSTSQDQSNQPHSSNRDQNKNNTNNNNNQTSSNPESSSSPRNTPSPKGPIILQNSHFIPVPESHGGDTPDPSHLTHNDNEDSLDNEVNENLNNASVVDHSNLETPPQL